MSIRLQYVLLLSWTPEFEIYVEVKTLFIYWSDCCKKREKEKKKKLIQEEEKEKSFPFNSKPLQTSADNFREETQFQRTSIPRKITSLEKAQII